MIAGRVTANGLPKISLRVAGRTFRAVIDTGFNGALELPDSLRDSVNAQLIGRATSLLAGGVAIEEDVYHVDFPFDRRRIRADATFVAGEEILVGTKLLQNYRLEIDFAKRSVRIERVE